MATSRKVEQGTAGTSATEIIEVPTGFVLQVNVLLLNNYSASEVSGVIVHVAQDGGAAADGNEKAHISLTVNEISRQISGVYVQAGGKIYVQAGTASAVNYELSYTLTSQTA